MNTALEIMRAFQRIGYPLARYCPITGAWRAQSQYGYGFAVFANRKSAIRHTLSYYAERMNLIRQ